MAQVRFECFYCGTKFEESEYSLYKIRCPECGDKRVREIENRNSSDSDPFGYDYEEKK